MRSSPKACNNFRISTYKTGSNRRTLTSFRMNTSAKLGGGGFLLTNILTLATLPARRTASRGEPAAASSLSPCESYPYDLMTHFCATPIESHSYKKPGVGASNEKIAAYRSLPLLFFILAVDKPSGQPYHPNWVERRGGVMCGLRCSAYRNSSPPFVFLTVSDSDACDESTPRCVSLPQPLRLSGVIAP
jgi:hypothetical protein